MIYFGIKFSLISLEQLVGWIRFNSFFEKLKDDTDYL